MAIPIHVNNAQTTFAASHAIGGTTLTMAAGYGATLAARLTALGLTLDANNPIRVTAIKRTALNTYGQITDLTKLTIFEVTGRSTDTLTGATVVEGTTDQAFVSGDTLAVLWTAGAAKELRDAVALASTVGSLDDLSDVTITTATTGDLLRYNGSAWANSTTLPTHAHDDRYYTETEINTLLSGFGSGTVTSVALTVPTGLSVSGSPITSSGTLAITTALSGIVKASAGAFSAAVSGTDYSAPGHAHAAADITSGTLSVAQGGTGATTFASGAVLVGAGTSAVAASNLTYASTTLSLGVASGGDGTVNSTSHGTKGVLNLNGTLVRISASGQLQVGATVSTVGTIAMASSGGIWYRSAANTSDLRLFDLGRFQGSIENNSITMGGGATPRISIEVTNEICLLGSLSLFATGSFGGGNRVIFIADRTTAPTSNPTGGGLLYCESGALKYRGSSGTVTTLGPA